MAQAKLIDISAPGEKLSDEDARPLREEVARLLGRSQKGFPGAQPVSFSRKHVGELMKQECVFPPTPHPPARDFLWSLSFQLGEWGNRDGMIMMIGMIG